MGNRSRKVAKVQAKNEAENNQDQSETRLDSPYITHYGIVWNNPVSRMMFVKVGYIDIVSEYLCK